MTEAGLAHTALWGLARVVALEHPEWRCTCLDVSPEATVVQQVVADLLAATPECHIVLRHGERRVARLLPYVPASGASAQPVQLVTTQPGHLENLTWQRSQRRVPAYGEVEIRIAATGLNFRDVLNAMGQYPGAPSPLGCECAGEVVAVGAGVTDLHPAQAVMGLAPGSFGQYVTVNRALVTPVPEGVSLPAATTLPVAFLTAHYGLCQLAQLQADEYVLIHAAAGGVGQAALQIARRLGARILPTASPEKWAWLQAQGVKQVMNSRTLDFADTVLAMTQGQGVDVVLNSLAGAFRAKSVAVLSRRGRFIELGKGNLWTPEQVRQVKPEATYCTVDLVALCEQQPALIQTLLQQLAQQVASGHLLPLSYSTWPLEEAVQAFRTMQQARHIGKLVLTQSAAAPGSSAPRPVVFRPDATYLITGGLGALGLRVAAWMVTRGAKHVLLLSRRTPDASTRQQIQQLEQQGATVVVSQTDVCQTQALQAVLQQIEATSYPLRGVVHAAGVLDDGVLQQLDRSRLARVLAPKVQGAWNLHTLTRDQNLDFFVLFSSAAAVLGSPGQGNHAAANAFLDALAHYRRQAGLPALSVNWGAWAEIGAAAQQGVDFAAPNGVALLAPSQGLEILETLWDDPLAQVVAIPIRWADFLSRQDLAQAPFFAAFRHHLAPVAVASAPAQAQVLWRQQLAVTPPEKQRQLLEAHVEQHLGQVLGLQPGELDWQAGFFDLGLDSLTALELKNGLQASLGCALPATLAFDYPTVAALVDYLALQVLPGAEAASAARPSVAVPAQGGPLPAPPATADIGALLDQKLAELDGFID
jgi:NADPH:quinone reductase-like Zn-dependent oxidoreductase/acyl carrier protein